MYRYIQVRRGTSYSSTGTGTRTVPTFCRTTATTVVYSALSMLQYAGAVLVLVSPYTVGLRVSTGKETAVQYAIPVYTGTSTVQLHYR